MKKAAKDAGVPILAVKSSSPSNLLRALRTVLGIEPSAGGTFLERPRDGALAADGEPLANEGSARSDAAAASVGLHAAVVSRVGQHKPCY